MTSVAFDRLGHAVRVPVEVDGEAHRFLVDTGIGITVISSAFAERSDVAPTRQSYAGRRMSGQPVEAPLVRLPMLQLGEYRLDGHLAGVADLGEGFTGILGPSFFGSHAFTVDPNRMTLAVTQAPQATADGDVVSLQVRRDGPSAAPFASLVLPSGRTISVEVDTGTASLILHTSYLADCGLSPGSPSIETSTGTDETGYHWTRHRATIEGSVHLADAPETAHERPQVLFQDIIHDGLVGTEYLERYRVTFDISGSRMILASRSSEP